MFEGEENAVYAQHNSGISESVNLCDFEVALIGSPAEDADAIAMPWHRSRNSHQCAGLAAWQRFAEFPIASQSLQR
jgi:hypothetical protein